MWYILYMNKDVIYVEPEDDITDIILKIENSKEKIVALVPPKKAGVFRSVVNIKLIAKSGATSNKKVVLVTVDPSIMRLAGAARIPVTKNLQTAPVIPEVTDPGRSLRKSRRNRPIPVPVSRQVPRWDLPSGTPCRISMQESGPADSRRILRQLNRTVFSRRFPESGQRTVSPRHHSSDCQATGRRRAHRVQVLPAAANSSGERV